MPIWLPSATSTTRPRRERTRRIDALPARARTGARAPEREERADHDQQQKVGQRHAEQRHLRLAVAKRTGPER